MTSLAILGARIIDPETERDALGDVLIRDGKISAVLEPGAQVNPHVPTLDGRGLVLAPGFIDVHSHSHDVAGLRLQACDGVTTALELELGLYPVEAAYRRAAVEGRPINYGFSASWTVARMLILGELAQPSARLADYADHVGQPGWQRTASQSEIDRLVGNLEQELGAGALGIGLMPAFAPGTAPAEIARIGQLAATSGRATYSHVRDLIEVTPTVAIDGITEVVEVARTTGARMHICHIHSVSTRHIGRVLDTVGQAQSDGAAVTTEAYPYGFGMTNIGAAFLTPDGLRARGLTPSSLIYAPTGEPIDNETQLLDLRSSDPAALVFVENLRESEQSDVQHLTAALTAPDGLIASDAMPLARAAALGGPDKEQWPLPPDTITHPRTAGCYGRALRTLYRQGPLSLLDVIRRATLLPAQLLEPSSLQFRRKGRVQVGCDADLVLFDPEQVSDQATYAASTRTSTGFRAVLVGGEYIVRDGLLVPDVMPGRPLRGG